jgi:hypothetical protein
VCPWAKQEFFLTTAGSNAFGKIGYGLMVIYVARGMQQIKVAEFNHHFQFLERQKNALTENSCPFAEVHV